MTIAISIASVLVVLHLLRYFEVITIDEISFGILHCLLMIFCLSVLTYITPSPRLVCLALIFILLSSYCRTIGFMTELKKLKDQGVGEIIRITGGQDGKTTIARIIEKK